MNKKNLFSIVILVLAVAIVLVNVWKPSTTEGNKNVSQGIVINGNTQNSKTAQVKEGYPAPDFELPTLEGETIKLSDYRGKKIILNFWASWCPPCKAEMPFMQSFYEKNKDKVEIVAVNLTNIDNGRTAIKEFVEDYGLTFPIPLDEEGEIGQLYQAFSIPTSYIIDSNGIITKKVIGPMDEEMMEALTKNID